MYRNSNQAILSRSPPKIATKTNLEVAGGVEEQIARLQVAMKHVGGMNILETAQNLVKEVADVIVRQLLRLQ